MIKVLQINLNLVVTTDIDEYSRNRGNKKAAQ